MKIGIISINMYSKGLNFACPLHNYAFQQFLLKNGIDSTVISYKPIYFNDYNLRHPYDYYASMCNNFASSGRNETEVEEWKRITGLRDSWRALYEERERRYDKFQNFIDSNYIKTEECYDSDLLEIKDPGFDCYICCTDVIWKKEPNAGFDRGFFLASKAMENKWKISYAASRGVFFSENEEDEKQFLGYVSDIDAISVREDSLKQYLDENIENEVTKVVDPVLLHDKEFYENILIKPQEEHYIFLYYVMERAEDTIEQAVKYARAHNLKIVEITDRPLKDGRLSEYEGIERIYNYDMGIEEWLGYIMHADCIFTNSFHACCFSVLFEKQLYVGTRNGDKVTHLLDMFGLSGRRINKESDILTAPLPDIDYDKVRPILKERQKESSDFILSAIRRMEHSQKEQCDYGEKRKNLTYELRYNSGAYPDVSRGSYGNCEGEVRKLNTGSWELFTKGTVKNDESSCLIKNRFSRKGYLPAGWKLRFKIDRKWFWYLEDGSLVPQNEHNEECTPVRVFEEGERLPHIPVNHISLAVADAFWSKEVQEYTLIYGSVLKSEKTCSAYDTVRGVMQIDDAGVIEYRLNKRVVNDGNAFSAENCFSHPDYNFVGWNIRIEDDRGWFWYLEDGSFKRQEDYCERQDEEKYILKPDGKIPYIPFNTVRAVVLDAVWTVKVMYYSGAGAGKGTYKDSKGRLREREDGSWEFFPKALSMCDDGVRFRHNEFNRKGYVPDGWKLRVKTKDGWKWHLEDGTYIKAEEYRRDSCPPIRHFSECDVIPVLPKKEASCMVAEALWRKEELKYKVVYCSGLKSKQMSCRNGDPAGCIMRSEGGFAEYRPESLIVNDGSSVLEKNRFEHPGYDFVGWRMKAEVRGKWYWYLEDGTLRYEKEYCEKKNGKRYFIEDQGKMPYVPSGDVRNITLEGVWQPKIKYCSGSDLQDAGKGCYEESEGKVKKVADGIWEFDPGAVSMYEDFQRFHKNKFSRKGYLPDGWKVRFRDGDCWYWMLDDGSSVKMDEYDEKVCRPVKRFSEYASIPWEKLGAAQEVMAEALWKKGAAEIKIIYNSGRKTSDLAYHYDESKGKTKILGTGSAEFYPKEIVLNNGENILEYNHFAYPGHKFFGWRMRIKENGKWYWYLQNGDYKIQEGYDEKKDGNRYLFKDGSKIPYIPSSYVAVVVLEAVWQIELKAIAGKAAIKVIDKIRKIRG